MQTPPPAAYVRITPPGELATIGRRETAVIPPAPDRPFYRPRKIHRQRPAGPVCEVRHAGALVRTFNAFDPARAAQKPAVIDHPQG